MSSLTLDFNSLVIGAVCGLGLVGMFYCFLRAFYERKRWEVWMIYACMVGFATLAVVVLLGLCFNISV